MYCTQCRAQNPDNARYCNQCGSEIRTGQSPSGHGGGAEKKSPQIIIIAILVALMGAAIAFYLTLSVQRDADNPAVPEEKNRERPLFQDK